MQGRSAMGWEGIDIASLISIELRLGRLSGESAVASRPVPSRFFLNRAGARSMMTPPISNASRHPAELKQQVLAACAEPGASVAQVALTHGLNANLVHKWRRTLEAGGADAKLGTRQTEFVPVALAAGPAEAGHIQVELRRGAMAVNVMSPSGT